MGSWGLLCANAQVDVQRNASAVAMGCSRNGVCGGVPSCVLVRWRGQWRSVALLVQPQWHYASLRKYYLDQVPGCYLSRRLPNVST